MLFKNVYKKEKNVLDELLKQSEKAANGKKVEYIQVCEEAFDKMLEQGEGFDILYDGNKHQSHRTGVVLEIVDFNKNKDADNKAKDFEELLKILGGIYD